MEEVKKLAKFIAFEVGLQIPCCFYSLKAAEGLVWASPAAFGEDIPCSGAVERMPDFGGAFAPGSCSYVYHNSPEAPSGLGDWLPEREERDCRGSGVWRQGAQFHWGAPLGSGIRGIHRWV